VLDLAVKCGACKSNGDAKRLIKSGGLYLNNQRVEGPEGKVGSEAAIEGRVCVVRTGKKKYFLVKLTD
jgi:tyrosyl-tRNA synthetase